MLIHQNWKLKRKWGFGGKENGWLLLNGYRVSVWGDSKVLETDHGDGHTTLGM